MPFSLPLPETEVKLSMNHRLLDPRAELINQLVYFDEEFSEEFMKLSAGSAEKVVVQSLVDRYRSQVSQLLAANDVQDRMDATIVLIGCKVVIRYESDGQEDAYTIVLPNHSNIDEGHVSFLSPLGRNLLLRQAGDVVSVDSPAGVYQVRIMEVTSGSI